jgi:chromate transporter
MQAVTTYSLRDLLVYFLKLGTIGFGGPVALVGFMHRDLVERRQWISEEDYRNGLALAQLMPGPLAAQLSIYLGYVHYRVLGATLVGLAFILPSFIMVVLIGMAYVGYGGLPWMQHVFYGVGAAVIGIILISVYKLTIKTVSKLDSASVHKNAMLWLFYVTLCAITVYTEREEVLLFVLAGLVYMAKKAPPHWLRKPDAMGIFPLFLLGSGQWKWGVLGDIAWFFTKAGAFVFGSGLAIIPFLHSGTVLEHHWLTEQQFLDAVAVAMITPGPVVITVGFIGFLVAGFAGALVAAVATFFPCYVFTVVPAPYVKRLTADPSMKAFVDGITAAVVGALLGAVIVIARRTLVDLPSVAIAFCTIMALLRIKKLSEPIVILIAGGIGLFLKNLF